MTMGLSTSRHPSPPGDSESGGSGGQGVGGGCGGVASGAQYGQGSDSPRTSASISGVLGTVWRPVPGTGVATPGAVGRDDGSIGATDGRPSRMTSPAPKSANQRERS